MMINCERCKRTGNVQLLIIIFSLLIGDTKGLHGLSTARHRVQDTQRIVGHKRYASRQGSAEKVSESNQRSTCLFAILTLNMFLHSI